MNKTTIKISVLAFLGFMTYGYAQQQQQDPYRGKVGINTVTPSATMDVQPNSDNARVEAKTNEGIIAPKLSKTRIANIETPVEGTLVYATDETTSPISAYTGGDTKVAKITEKGYYFYNGTEWVKAGSDATDQLWAQRDNGGVTETYLKPAENDGTSFTYKKSEVEITSKDSGYNNTNQGLSNISGYGINSRRYNNIGYGPALSLVAGRGSIATPEASQVGDTLGRIYFNPTPSVSTANAGYGVSIVSKLVEKQNDTSYATSLQIGVRNIGESYPIGAIHISPNRNVGIGKIADGFRLDVHGMVRSHGIEIKNQGNIGPSFSIRNNSKDKPHQANKWVLYNMTDTDPNTPGGYNDGLVFWSYNSDESAGGPKLMLTDSGSLIVGAKYTYINTSLPTEKLVVDGNAKIQSLSGTGDRVVVADQDGVLKVGDASTALARAVWTPDTSSNSVKLAITSAKGDRTTHPVSITDEGMVRATSFQGVNGATIFPDYVFQKYYTGTSSIKADYNFKTLSQVENFVKTNGHLPGYQSAETIKKQGYVDLMATQLTNVEKIEELYLHLLEKDKEVKDLKAKNKDLEARLQKLETLLVK